MRVNFGVDNGQASGFAGYINGLATEVQTNRYISSVVSYTYKRLASYFEDAADAAARRAPDSFKHMYEWGSSYGDTSTVGLPDTRLWRLVSTGSGRNRSVTFTFLPSVRPVPINPILTVPGKTGKTVREGVHVFTWKARVQEEGTPVTIKRISAKYLAFVGSDSQIKFRKGPMTVTPRSHSGVFSEFFLAWWNIEGPDMFDRIIRPEIENDLFPNTKISEVKSKFKVKMKPMSISAVSGAREFSAGTSWGKADLKAKERKYEIGSKRLRYGD